MSMQCPNCHTELPDGAKFCGVCGNKIIDQATQILQPAPANPVPVLTVETKSTSNNNEFTQNSKPAVYKTSKLPLKAILIISSVALLCAAAIITAVLLLNNNPKVKIENFLSNAAKYLVEMNYEQAIIEFDKLLKIDPMNVDAYLGKAKALVALGEIEEAYSLLEEGYSQTGDERIFEMLKSVDTSAASSSVDNSGYNQPNESEPNTNIIDSDTDIIVRDDAPFTDQDIENSKQWLTIENNIVVGCSEKATKVVIPEGVTGIDSYVFSHCNDMISIFIPSSVTHISSLPICFDVFSKCSSLREIVVHEDNAFYASKDGALYSKDMTELYCCPSNKSGKTFFIPDETSSYINGAFLNCKNLEEIKVGVNNTSFVSKDGVLYDKDMTVLLFYPPEKTNSSYVIPDGITGISSFAFLNSRLESITIPESVEYIYYMAFSESKNLKSVNIPDGVTLGEGLIFNECTNLKSVTYKGRTYSYSNIDEFYNVIPIVIP